MGKGIVRLMGLMCAVVLLVQLPVVVKAAPESELPEVSSDTALSGVTEAGGVAGLAGEVSGLREESVKYFRRVDGSITAAVYGQPVHYEEDGVLKDIDNTLHSAAAADGRAVYTNAAGILAVEFPAHLDGVAAVRVGYKGYSISWSLDGQSDASAAAVEQPLSRAELAQAGAARAEAAAEEARARAQAQAAEEALTGAQAQALVRRETEDARISAENEAMMSLANQASAVTYADALPGRADLRYDLSSNRLKESIILETIPLKKSFGFQIAAPDLAAELNEDGSVSFYAAGDAAPLFVIESPYMFDAQGATSYGVAVSLSRTETGYRYVLTPDRAWLADAARVWPVTLDPTIVGGGSNATVKNATQGLTSNSTGLINHLIATGEYQYLHSGRKICSGIYSELGTLVQIDLPSSITAAHRIIDARMNLRYFRGPTWSTLQADTEFRAYRITSAWSVGANKINYYNANFTYDSTPVDYVVINDIAAPGQSGSIHNQLVTLDITKAARAWEQGTANHGILLRGVNLPTSSERYARLYNAQHSLAGTDPYMVFTYRDSKGIEDYWTYTSLSVDSTTASVNNYNGHLVVTQPISGVDGNRMPVSIDLVYNEFQKGHNDIVGSKLRTVVGYGWRTNFHIQLLPTADSAVAVNHPFCLYDSDGTEHYFIKKGSSTTTFIDEDGLGYTLVVSGTLQAPTGYTLTAKDGSKMVFDGKGLIQTISEPGNLNTITVRYKNAVNYSGEFLIDRIEDGAGEEYTFQYYNNTITGITDPAGRTTNLSLWGGYLSQITHPDGTTTTFTYGMTGDTRNITGAGMGRIQKSDGARLDIYQTERATGQKLRINYPAEWAAYLAGGPYTKKWHQVTTIVNYSAQGHICEQYNFAYGANSTTIKPYYANTALGTLTYNFNQWGQTVSIVDGESGLAQYYEYGAPGGVSGTENKLTSASQTLGSVVNYIINPSFQSGLNAYTTHYVSGQATVAASSVGRGDGKSVCVTRTSGANLAGVRQNFPGLRMGAHKTVILKITIKASVRQGWQRNNGYLAKAEYPLFFCRREKQ